MRLAAPPDPSPGRARPPLVDGVAQDLASSTAPAPPARAGWGWSATQARSAAATFAAGTIARDLLVLLVCADVALIALHGLHVGGRFFSAPHFSIGMEGGLGEALQYAKQLWIALGCLWLARRTREGSYAAWGLAFAYLLADDALSIHEGVGKALAARHALPIALGLRGQDVGELLALAAVGTLILALVGVAWVRGSPTFRRRAGHLLLLTGLLALFGVVVDAVHGAARELPRLSDALAVVEDGGEMLVVSVICAYVVATLITERAHRPA